MKQKTPVFLVSFQNQILSFFVLSMLTGVGVARKNTPNRYQDEINKRLEKINDKDSREKSGFTSVMKIPQYTKRTYQCRQCFEALFAYHPELLEQLLKTELQVSQEQYSEISRLLARILELTGCLRNGCGEP